MPPLSKGGGLTASHKLSLCCVLLATRPPFYSLNFSAVKTEGLLYHPSLSTTSMPPLSKVRCCRPKKFGRLPEGLPHHHPSPLTNPSKNRTIPRKSPTYLPFNERSVCFASLPRQPLVPLYRIPPLSKTTINPKRKALKRSPVAKTGNGASVLYISFTLSICPHLQQAQRFRVRDYPSSQAYILRLKFRLFRRCRQASAYSCYRLPCRLRSACRCLYGQ